MRRYLSFFVGLVVATGLLGLGCTDPEAASSVPSDETASVPDSAVFDIRSVTLDARNQPEPELLPALSDGGVTHLTLVSFARQRAPDHPQVRIDTSAGWYSESHRGIRALAQRADTLDMDVILKPHIWVGGYSETQDRSEIGFDSEADWQRWEDQYRQFIMIYARLAAEVDADVLVLGTELSRAARERPAFWRDLAERVRTVYDGALTYAANWHKEYQHVAFWDALDYVGVQAYFPLAESDDPSLAALRAGWEEHMNGLAQVHRRTGKPVLFTEVGYRSSPTTAETPWRWPQHDDAPIDPILQARCYEAFFSTVGQAPWLAGAIIWKWHPAAEGNRPDGYTPQGKPAEQVVRRWFTGTAAPVRLNP